MIKKILLTSSIISFLGIISCITFVRSSEGFDESIIYSMYLLWIFAILEIFSLIGILIRGIIK